MSVRERLKRFDPRRIVRTADEVAHLQRLADRLEHEQRAIAQQQKTTSRQLRKIARQLETIELGLGRQQQVLDGVPELRNLIQQCMTAYARDARDANRLPALRARLGTGERLASHAAAAVARGTLEIDPFPHLIVEDLLPKDIADELVAALPESVFFTQTMSRQEMKVPFSFAPEFSRLVWNTFFETVITRAMVSALTDKFRPALDDFLQLHWPELGSMAESGISLRVTNSRVLLRRPGYVIKPHRDPRWAFLTCLVYLPKPGETESYGTQLYRLLHEPEMTHSSPLWVDEQECELVKDVPARANTALVFLNSVGAHGASIPGDAPAALERHLYQVQFGVDEETRRRLIGALNGMARESWAVARGEVYR